MKTLRQRNISLLAVASAATIITLAPTVLHGQTAYPWRSTTAGSVTNGLPANAAAHLGPWLPQASNAVTAAYSRYAWSTNLNARKLGSPRLSTTNVVPHLTPKTGKRVVPELGPHSRTWTVTADAATVSPTTANGALPNPVTTLTRSRGQRVVEIASGMNYWDGQTWVPSVPIFELTAQGDAFVASRVQHKIRLSADINVAGAVTTTTPDGLVLRSTPVAIGLLDPVSGRFGVIGTLTNCAGVLFSSNQVVYAKPFHGVCASLLYSIERGSFSQDVIITGRLDPQDYGFPTNSRVQIITEFYSPPQPQITPQALYVEQNPTLRATMVSPDLVDEGLLFGELAIGPGRAFSTMDGADHTNGVPVAKEFKAIGGRTFLIESADYASLQDNLLSLPDCDTLQGSVWPNQPEALIASCTLIPEPPAQASSVPQGDRAALTGQQTTTGAQPGQARQVSPSHGLSASTTPLASAPTTRPQGVVIDYEATVGPGWPNPAVFAGDTTYFVSGPTICGQIVIEGGAVFKYPFSTTTAYLQFNGTATTKATTYRPIFFTAGDDDSIGSTLQPFWQGYTGTIQPGTYYANPAIYVATSSLSLTNCRFYYAQKAIQNYSSLQSVTLNHSQLVKCATGIEIDYPVSTPIVNVNNTLMSQVQIPFVSFVGLGHVPFNLIHCTIDQATKLSDGNPPKCPQLTCTNCVIANIATSGVGALAGDHNGFYNAAQTFGTHQSTCQALTGPFQAADSGLHYLASNSGFQQQGAASGISASLLNDLKSRTTTPPMAFPPFMEVTGELTLFPQIPRYVSGPPDLGYGYDALDYTVAWMTCFGTVTVLPGTAIGFCNEFVPGPGRWTWFGFDLREGSSFISHGTPAKPNIFTDVQLVHEPQAAPCNACFLLDFLPGDASLSAPSLDFRFSQFYASPVWYHFWGGYDEGTLGLPFPPTPDSLVNWSLRDCSISGGKINLGNPDDGWYFPPDYVYGTGSVSWVNNTFDRVSINLDPTYYSYDLTTVNCVMQVQAYNNLFRGGTWFHLSPVPTSGGNWVFKDNLFDKVDFVQEIASPLDYDYNAYWPLTQSELDGLYQWYPWTTANAGQLLPTIPINDLNGGHEQALVAAPAYQSGPLGAFYLATSSPLYNTANRGSRSAAEAGLYHYTTRTDQTKDGAQTGNVIIGRHYVATTGANSAQPKDSDTGGGDGIPDYVENWHGDGRRDWPDETDWQNAYTVAGIYDPTNTAYDDIDLSGSGLVGRIKKAIRIGPFDTSNPLTPTQIITGQEPDIASFLVPVNYDVLTNIGKLELYANGAPISYQQCTRDANTNCVLLWNTTFNWPGLYYLQPTLTLNGQIQRGATPDTTILTASGPIAGLYSDNVAKFDPFYWRFDSDHGAILYASVPEEGADYSIELRTPSGQHITTITGSTPSFAINKTWYPLTDDNSNPFTGDSVDAVFHVTLPSLRSGYHKFRLHLATSEVPDGEFTVAYAWDNNNEALGAMWDAIQLGAVDPLIKPPSEGGLNEDFYNSSFNDFTWWGDLIGDPGYLSSQPDAINLVLNILPLDATRNFYFNGHGSPTELGDGGRGQVSIGVGNVAARLHNLYDTVDGIWDQHPYRFVFLDACETANDPQWAHAFGILDRITTDQLSDRGDEVQAFVGWYGSPRAPEGAEWYDIAVTYELLFNMWMTGYSLHSCIYVASQEHPNVPPYTLNFPLGKEYHWTQSSILVPRNDFRIRIYGYAGICRSGYIGYIFDDSQYYR